MIKKDNNRIIIPYLNLDKFYRICSYKETSPESIKLKEKTFKRYVKLKEIFFGELVNAETLSIFIDKLKKKILLKVISQEELQQLVDKPLNPNTIKRLLELYGREISNTSAKALLSLLIKVNLIDQVNIIKNIDINEKTNQDKELIYFYLLRRRDFISLKDLKKKFFNHPRKHKIDDYLIELWLEKKVDIGRLDVPREICNANNNDYKDLPLEKVERFKSIEKYVIRETGELKARISIHNLSKLYPLNKGD